MSSNQTSLVDRKVGTRIAKMLYESQHKHGYLKTSEIERIADHVGEPLIVIQDVVGFFPHYRRTPPPKCSIHVCRDMTCRLRGSAAATEKLTKWMEQLEVPGPGKDPLVELHEASCLGRCDRAYATIINDELYVQRTPDELVEIASKVLVGASVTPDSDLPTARESLERSEIDYYRYASPTLQRYAAVREYIRAPNPEGVIKGLETAGLVGMGGAGAPTFRKWSDAKQAAGVTKYVVCNADESEPGTFKDRELLVAAPHLIIEGMIMAALVIEAQQGIIYVRHEYQEQIAALKAEIVAAEKQGACGKNVFGSGRSFNLEVFVSPGGYVCGEQTALIEAIEGKRSEPRNRPPELETNGLYDQPTVLNNAETFAWVPAILLKPPSQEATDQEFAALERSRKSKEAFTTLDTSSSNAPGAMTTKLVSDPQAVSNQFTKPSELEDKRGVWFKYAGKNRIRGKRFFSISGDLEKPGVYEVPCGITLGELIDNYAGGMKDGIELQAVAMSGPSGGFLPSKLPKGMLREPKTIGADNKPTVDFKYPGLAGDLVDIKRLPLDIGISRELGYPVGAGIVIYGANANMLEQAVACSRFFQRESCGKCVPCRLGTRKIADLAELYQLTPFAEVGEQILGNIAILDTVMREPGVCICALGASASAPLASYIKYFRPTTSSGKA